MRIFNFTWETDGIIVQILQGLFNGFHSWKQAMSNAEKRKIQKPEDSEIFSDSPQNYTRNEATQ